jgi:iron complex transport system substrate-binding protein
MTHEKTGSFVSRTLARHFLLIVVALCCSPLAISQAGEERRIVAAGGAITEVLYVLGVERELVGVDTTSLYPSSARDKPNVGYVRALSPEGVLSLRPTLLIAIEAAGPPEVLALIEQSGVRVARIPEDLTPEGTGRRIEAIGRLVDKDKEAQDLARAVEARFAALAARTKGIERPIKAMFVMSLQSGRPLVAGRGTAADRVIHLAGAQNAAVGFDGYKPMSDEAVIAAAPDVLVMMSNRPGAPEEVLTNTAIGATPAGRERRIVTMDGNYLLGFGPRAPDAVSELMGSLYPDRRASSSAPAR